jgi:hypothetical protein
LRHDERGHELFVARVFGAAPDTQLVDAPAKQRRVTLFVKGSDRSARRLRKDAKPKTYEAKVRIEGLEQFASLIFVLKGWEGMREAPNDGGERGRLRTVSVLHNLASGLCKISIASHVVFQIKCSG